MGEDCKGDATASQHHPVAVSQCLLMIYSCRVVGGGLRGGEERHTHRHPLSSHQLWPAVFQSAPQSAHHFFMQELTLPTNNSLTSYLSAIFSTKERDEFETFVSVHIKKEIIVTYFVLGFGAEVFRFLPAACRQVQDGSGGHVSSLSIVGVVIDRALSVTVESEAG